MKSILVLVTIFIFLSACATDSTNIATTSAKGDAPGEMAVSSAPSADVVAVSSEAVVEQEESANKVTWQIPEWCEDLEQNFNQVQVCGIAEHPNLQMSRTRSELDARKQLARRQSGQVSEVMTETVDDNGGAVTATSVLTSNSEVSRYVIEKQQTIENDGKYLTFTKVIQYFN